MIHIQSISDIITNSSSEVFLVKTDKTPREIIEELKYFAPNSYYDNEIGELRENSCSGMGGELTAYNNKTISEYDLKYQYENCINGVVRPKYEYLPEGYLYVDIDWGFVSKIHYLIKNYNVLDIDDVSGFCKRDKKTKIITSDIRFHRIPTKDDIREHLYLALKPNEEWFECSIVSTKLYKDWIKNKLPKNRKKILKELENYSKEDLNSNNGQKHWDDLSNQLEYIDTIINEYNTFYPNDKIKLD